MVMIDVLEASNTSDEDGCPNNLSVASSTSVSSNMSSFITGMQAIELLCVALKVNTRESVLIP